MRTDGAVLHMQALACEPVLREEKAAPPAPDIAPERNFSVSALA